MTTYLRDDIFVPGGQPTITYVDREDQHIERELARAIATPNQIASLAGPTKTGKTVLCKKVLQEREYLWVDGGKVKTASDFWECVKSELNMPIETTVTDGGQILLKAEATAKLLFTAGGSHLSTHSETRKLRTDSLSNVLESMISEKIALVIDDFHYIPEEARIEIMRNIKGAVFNGLKLILLSVSHRVFDAIRDESELTGRFTAVELPHWNKVDLRKIPLKGFEALKVEYPAPLLDTLCDEAQESPFLMQRFCWEICFDSQIERTAGLLHSNIIPTLYDPYPVFMRIAKDSGLPIYQKLKAGPQSRKKRELRPLRGGGEADIYEVVLQAIAETGPKATIKYDDIREEIGKILTSSIPRKHEITSALKHLAKISQTVGSGSALDWNEHNREINMADPYLRFYLRWRIRKMDNTH